mmetsp:Transcript_14711/g.22878  ORF Transcript_14711/g.22878 Transcript_14711/m.22878 type:complete len:82 (+) Transcript_14711:71-316(+)
MNTHLNSFQNMFGLRPEARPQVQPTSVAAVMLAYEDKSFNLHLDITASVAAFSVRVYLATGVFPNRQKIIGFAVSPQPLRP